MRGLDIEQHDVYEIAGMLDLRALDQIADLDIPALHPSLAGRHARPPGLTADPDEGADVFAAMREGDILLHHPYDSFTATVQRFIEQAVDDPTC
jgi:polyphosphate kinase